MTKTSSSMMILLLSLVCCTSSATNQAPVGIRHSGGHQASLGDGRVNKYPIADSIGVVTLNEERRSKEGFVNIYNEDGSLWYKFSFSDDEPFENVPTDFRPIAFKPDYYLLALKCVGKSAERYEVVVNEETAMKKHVRADDPTLKFQRWEEHILRVFAVDFNRKDNPVLDNPSGQMKNLEYSEGVTFHPVEIQGEWLKVRWNGLEKMEKNEKENVGWIKWKRNGLLSIELFYFA